MQQCSIGQLDARYSMLDGMMTEEAVQTDNSSTWTGEGDEVVG